MNPNIKPIEINLNYLNYRMVQGIRCLRKRQAPEPEALENAFDDMSHRTKTKHFCTSKVTILSDPSKRRNALPHVPNRSCPQLSI
ncbi:hypothetical protein TNCV_4636581 [Trichonephila clavipes]|nr:hypothetical protein TNCV_4636581 [Trichonephila clavipes]